MCEVFKCKIRRFILTPYFTKCEWKLTRMSITVSINILTIINIITMIVHYDHLLWASWSRSTPSERILRSAFCQPRSIDLSQPKSSHTLAAVEIILIIILLLMHLPWKTKNIVHKFSMLDRVNVWVGYFWHLADLVSFLIWDPLPESGGRLGVKYVE